MVSLSISCAFLLILSKLFINRAPISRFVGICKSIARQTAISGQRYRQKDTERPSRENIHLVTAFHFLFGGASAPEPPLSIIQLHRSKYWVPNF